MRIDTAAAIAAVKLVPYVTGQQAIAKSS